MRNYQEHLTLRRTSIEKTKKISLRTISTLMVMIGAVMMLFPYVFMVICALKTQQEIMSTSSILKNFWPTDAQWHNFIDVFKGSEQYGLKGGLFLDSIKNTLIIEILVVPIGTFVSTLAAFAFAKMKFPGKTVILITILTSMMIPYAVVMLPQYRAWKELGLTNTLWPLIIGGFFGNVGMMFYLITTIKAYVPDSLIEESRVEGAGWFKTFWKVVVPLIKPAIIAQMLFWFVGIWNDFFGPSIYLTDPNKKTVQVLIMSLNSSSGAVGGGNTPLVMAVSFLSSLPIIILFILMNKSFVQTNANSGIKG